MKRFAAVISYDGSNFFGFQFQKDVRTVQGVIEEALERIFKTKVNVIGAGRTDTGVHAIGQVVAFDCPFDIQPENMKNALNANLPDDVYVRRVEEVPKDFNPRFHATRRIYHYLIHNSKTPNVFSRKYYWWFPYDLDVQKMREGARYLEGEHDFKAFAKVEEEKSTIRIINRIRIVRFKNDIILIRVEGKSFLRRMVRNIVGALVKVGVGVWEPSKIQEILESKNRSLGPATAPAHGLYLYSVEFSYSDKSEKSIT